MALQLVQLQYTSNLSHGVCLHPQQFWCGKDLRFFYCITAKNVLSYSSVSVALPNSLPHPYKTRSGETSLILITWYLHHMTRLISCDWSHQVWNASNRPPVPLGGTNTAEVYSFHFPRVFTQTKKQTRFPDGHSCVLNNTITTPDTGKHDYFHVVNQDYSSRFKKYNYQDFIQCVTYVFSFVSEWIRVPNNCSMKSESSCE